MLALLGTGDYII